MDGQGGRYEPQELARPGGKQRAKTCPRIHLSLIWHSVCFISLQAGVSRCPTARQKNETNEETKMKYALSLLMLTAGMTLVGCNDSVYDEQADAVRESSQEYAESVREQADNQAEQVEDRYEAAKPALEEAADERADAIEERGEEKADAIEEAGEQRADQLEELDDQDAVEEVE